MRLPVVCLAVLACLAAATPALANDSGHGDGTLALKNATGTVNLAVRGAVIGQVDFGKVTIQDPNPGDGKAPVVTGFESKRDLTDTKSLYSGSDIRFRVIGGFFRLKIVGTGVDLSVVGKGSVSLGPAAGLLTSGTFSFDGDAPAPMPDVTLSFPLGSGNGAGG
jgi:hypothetical protein